MARWAVLAGNFMDAQTAFDVGLLSHLVEVSEVDACISSLCHLGKPESKFNGKPNNEQSRIVQFAKSFYSDENMQAILNHQCPKGFDEQDSNVSRQLKSLKFTAPVGLQMAHDLINSSNLSLSDGLLSELNGLETIFSTVDALEGLSALIEGRKPTYVGK